jgi:outer membrane autotransporter protein
MSGTSMASPRVTGAAALAREAFKTDSGNAKTGEKSLGVSAWLGKTLDLSGGGLRLVLGAGCIRHDLKSRRSVTVGAVTEALGADCQGSSWQAFAEAAWGFSKKSLELEPCLALGWMGLKTGGFAERGGGLTALTSPPEKKASAFTQLGLRLGAPIGERASLGFVLGWRHTCGRLNSERRFRFQEGSNEFVIKSASPSRGEAVLAVSLYVKISEIAAITLSCGGSLGSRGAACAGAGALGFAWQDKRGASELPGGWRLGVSAK